jgi:hypothetical protein
MTRGEIITLAPLRPSRSTFSLASAVRCRRLTGPLGMYVVSFIGLLLLVSHRYYTPFRGQPHLQLISGLFSLTSWQAIQKGFRCSDGTKRDRSVLCPRNMRLKTLKAPGRRLSESRMRANHVLSLPKGSRTVRGGKGWKPGLLSQAPSPDPTTRRAPLRSARGLCRPLASGHSGGEICHL